MNTKTQQQPGQIIDLVKVQQARRALPEQKTLNGLAETFKVLSNPNRLKIIHTLAQQEMCVSDLAALLDSTDSAVSQTHAQHAGPDPASGEKHTMQHAKLAIGQGELPATVVTCFLR